MESEEGKVELPGAKGSQAETLRGNRDKELAGKFPRRAGMGHVTQTGVSSG